MKKISYTLFIISSLLIFPSCEKMVLGNDEANDPENCFELLWNDFDQHYATFTVKNIDWNTLYNEYRPLVNSATTEDELWHILTGILEHLDDGHVTLVQPISGANDRFFESGSTLNFEAEEEFDLDLIENSYLDYLKTTKDTDLSYGKVKHKDIGYIYLEGLGGDNPELIDDIIDKLKSHKAIILDVRNNGGGQDTYAHRFAGAFADGEHFIYTVQTKTGPGHDEFDEKKKWYTRKEGDEQYLKPVIFLTDRFTASAAEILGFNMKAFAHVTHMGDTTAGDHSDMSGYHFLPNGWVYSLAPQLYLTPEGECLESIGLAPDIYTENTKEEIESGIDNTLEEAIVFLFDEYGIE